MKWQVWIEKTPTVPIDRLDSIQPTKREALKRCHILYKKGYITKIKPGVDNLNRELTILYETVGQKRKINLK